MHAAERDQHSSPVRRTDAWSPDLGRPEQGRPRAFRVDSCSSSSFLSRSLACCVGGVNPITEARGGGALGRPSRLTARDQGVGMSKSRSAVSTDWGRRAVSADWRRRKLRCDGCADPLDDQGSRSDMFHVKQRLPAAGPTGSSCAGGRLRRRSRRACSTSVNSGGRAHVTHHTVGLACCGVGRRGGSAASAKTHDGHHSASSVSSGVNGSRARSAVATVGRLPAKAALTTQPGVCSVWERVRGRGHRPRGHQSACRACPGWTHLR